jgi:tRNA(Ile2) C34 agmatinyltransferase TiaS
VVGNNNATAQPHFLMKKLSSIIFLILFSIFSTASNAAPSLNEKTPSKQQIVIDDTMNELIKAGYVLQTQETRGIITVYVLKKGDEFAGCRVERSIKKEVEKCYEIELKKINEKTFCNHNSGFLISPSKISKQNQR